MHKAVEIIKRVARQQLVLTEVFVPFEVDTQGEYVSDATLEKAAHDFAANGNQNNVTIMHDGRNIDASVVESYIAKENDPLFKKGTWVAVIKIRDAAIWDAIEKGVLRGVSFEGNGKRRQTQLNGVAAYEMHELDIHTISLVDRPANRRKFKMTKAEHDLGQAFAGIAKAIEAQAKTLNEISAKLESHSDKITSIGELTAPKRKRVAKANPNADAIQRQLRKRELLQERLETAWERPDLASEDESEIRRRIAKCEDKLYELGYDTRSATMDGAQYSAFIQRGGVSTALYEPAASLDDLLGLSHSTRALRKHEKDVSLNCLVI